MFGLNPPPDILEEEEKIQLCVGPGRALTFMGIALLCGLAAWGLTFLPLERWKIKYFVAVAGMVLFGIVALLCAATAFFQQGVKMEINRDGVTWPPFEICLPYHVISAIRSVRYPGTFAVVFTLNEAASRESKSQFSPHLFWKHKRAIEAELSKSTERPVQLAENELAVAIDYGNEDRSVIDQFIERIHQRRFTHVK